MCSRHTPPRWVQENHRKSKLSKTEFTRPPLYPRSQAAEQAHPQLDVSTAGGKRTCSTKLRALGGSAENYTAAQQNRLSVWERRTDRLQTVCPVLASANIQKACKQTLGMCLPTWIRASSCLDNLGPAGQQEMLQSIEVQLSILGLGQLVQNLNLVLMSFAHGLRNTNQ